MSTESKSYQRWSRETYEPAARKQPERKSLFLTGSGIPVDPIYGPDERGASEPEFPGEHPFTRGIYPTMYRGRLWTMRQYAGYASAGESNERYRYLLSRGQTGLSVAFDLLTQMGYDADHELAEGEVGRVGVSISSTQDMAELFDHIPVDRVSTSMTINSTAPILLALYVANAKAAGVRPERLRGTVQNDILKEYIARGTYIYPPSASMRLVVDLIEYCRWELPRWNPISISGYHIREAGATAAQELAFTLANGIAYTEAALSRGLKVDEFASRLSFFFNVHNDFFEEIAKFRAARRLWARIMRDRFKAQESGSTRLRFHAQTAGSSLTAQQPYNNIVRTTIQAMAAVLGGAQSLHTNALDEALALPTAESAELALRTQQVIAYESGLANVIDPAGGSYFLESLTDRLEEEATAYLERVDDIGGAVQAVEAGYFQREISESAYVQQLRTESEEQIIVGVNDFIDESQGQSAPNLLSIDDDLHQRQLERIRAWRQGRDSSRAEAALSHLAEAAAGSANLMPFILAAVEAGCTLGEIADAMREIFGEHQGANVV